MLIFLAAATVSAVFFIDFCNWIYSCGCRSLWAGAAAHCNIHTAGVKHCPFCSFGTPGYGASYLAVLAPQGFLSFRPARWAWYSRFAAAVGVFPLTAAAIALPLGWATGYWN